MTVFNKRNLLCGYTVLMPPIESPLAESVSGRMGGAKANMIFLLFAIFDHAFRLGTVPSLSCSGELSVTSSPASPIFKNNPYVALCCYCFVWLNTDVLFYASVGVRVPEFHSQQTSKIFCHCFSPHKICFPCPYFQENWMGQSASKRDGCPRGQIRRVPRGC